MEHLTLLCSFGWDMERIRNMSVKWTLFVEEKYWKRQSEMVKAGLPHAGS